MDEEILETAKSICACGAEDEALLKRLCAASAQALERELREGVAPEDCEGAFICASAWLAAAALTDARLGGAAGQVRSEIVSRLKAAGLDAAEAYEDERFRERSGSVVAVGAKQAELAHAGLMNYLGEQYDAESGRTVEVYGRKLKMAASLDVYAPRRKGARGCEQTAEAVSEALLDGLADGLTLDELSWEKTEWDEEYGMFVRRGTARCTAYFVATADEESAVLTDFILKGVMQ